MSADPHDLRGELSRDDHELTVTAARWVERRDAGLNTEEQKDLQAWLRTDARHAKALASVDTQSSALNWPLQVGAADRVIAGLEQRAGRRRARRRLALAGTAVLLLLGASLLVSVRRAPSAGNTIVVHAPRQQILPDGSRVELDEGAEVAVAYTANERRIELLRGTAHFEVRKDSAHPFLVSTGSITARAVGTAFALGIEPQQVALLVTEGRVAVDRRQAAPAAAVQPAAAAEKQPLALVRAGEAVAVRNSPAASELPIVAPLPSAEWNSRLAWRIPRLEFVSTPLRDVVEMVNRYNREQLVLADDSLASLALSGALRADRIDGLLEMLEGEFHLTAIRRDGRILLQRGP